MIAATATLLAFPLPRSVCKKTDLIDVIRLCGSLEIQLRHTAEVHRPNTTSAVATLQRLHKAHGEQHLTMLLRTIVESEGNSLGLTEPVLIAVSAVMLIHPAWPATGLAWIEAFDGIDLRELQRLAKPMKTAGVKSASMIAGMLVQRLSPIFEKPKRRYAKRAKGN